jgi:hypothetical protein
VQEQHHVEDGLKERSDRLMHTLRLNLSRVLSEVTAERVEELEDFCEVGARLARPHRRVPDIEAWADLGRAG